MHQGKSYLFEFFFGVGNLSLFERLLEVTLNLCKTARYTTSAFAGLSIFGKGGFSNNQGNLKMKKIAFKITENKNSGVLHGGEHDDDGSHGHRCCRPECSTSSEDCSWVGWIMVVKMIWRWR